MEPLPTRSALVRIGKALAAGTETDEQLDQLDVLLGRCDEVEAEAVTRLIDALTGMKLESGAGLTVRGRTKTLVTLREKLVRMGGHQLPVIRDLAGLRIVGDMTLLEQDEVLFMAATALGIAPEDIRSSIVAPNQCRDIGHCMVRSPWEERESRSRCAPCSSMSGQRCTSAPGTTLGASFVMRMHRCRSRCPRGEATCLAPSMWYRYSSANSRN